MLINQRAQARVSEKPPIFPPCALSAAATRPPQASHSPSQTSRMPPLEKTLSRKQAPIFPRCRALTWASVRLQLSMAPSIASESTGMGDRKYRDGRR